ncbi:hypothetical protein [Stenotrophomonas sp. 24(2023)]|uniref:hypothetical protein n=1 Tax=Stenotrophomonas sp. 24(2023) TaxID=3068324 RepID=UPI0027E13355|nr:hypothetical protein [Stenotrophomonas sp. 24(2023)]WMJ69216.1 hypothetical protein Q9R17_18900 [Stenotrophomonas sp. 24(2023)]
MQMKPLRPPMIVVRDWATELSEKLGRPAQTLRENGLGARDFSSDTRVELRRPTGFTIAIPLSFCVTDAAKGVAVFSEHDGYIEFSLEEDDVASEIVEHTYRHGV